MIGLAWSFLVSSGSWLFVGGVTIFLFFAGLFFLWPLSLFLEQANGRLPHLVSQTWARAISFFLPFWEIRVQGLERIKKGRPYLVVSNHQSMLDIMVLLARLPLHFKFIAKHELFWIPILGWHLALAGYIPLKRGDPESGRLCLEKARGWLERGVSVVFFPEGTRSRDGLIHEFKAGAFKLALEGKFDLLPLAIRGTRETIPKYSWRIQKRSVLFLKILNPVPVKDRSPGELESIRDEVRSIIINEFEKLQ